MKVIRMKITVKSTEERKLRKTNRKRKPKKQRMFIRLKNRRESKCKKLSVKNGYLEILIKLKEKNPGRIIKMKDRNNYQCQE